MSQLSLDKTLGGTQWGQILYEVAFKPNENAKRFLAFLSKEHKKNHINYIGNLVVG